MLRRACAQMSCRSDAHSLPVKMAAQRRSLMQSVRKSFSLITNTHYNSFTFGWSIDSTHTRIKSAISELILSFSVLFSVLSFGSLLYISDITMFTLLNGLKYYFIV